jgi:hypothetical protein
MSKEEKEATAVPETQSEGNTPRWVSLYEKYKEAVLHPWDGNISSEEARE